MIGLYTALLLILMMVNMLVAMFIVWVLLDFLAMFWRRVITPSNPPWKRNHIGLNHGRTSNSTNIIKTRTLVAKNYKMAL